MESLCLKCRFGRATWSEELEKDGCTGCAYPAVNELPNRVIFSITTLRTFGEGWMYANRRPFDREKSDTLGKGITVNAQPIVKDVKECIGFKEI